jgi:hypothetical protein
VAVNVDTARFEKRGPFLDGVGVKTRTRCADPSGDAFETLHKDGKALGLPVTLVVDKDGYEVAAVGGRRQMGFGGSAGAGRGAEGRVGAARIQTEPCAG